MDAHVLTPAPFFCIMMQVIMYLKGLLRGCSSFRQLSTIVLVQSVTFSCSSGGRRKAWRALVVGNGPHALQHSMPTMTSCPALVGRHGIAQRCSPRRQQAVSRCTQAIRYLIKGVFLEFSPPVGSDPSVDGEHCCTQLHPTEPAVCWCQILDHASSDRRYGDEVKLDDWP